MGDQRPVAEIQLMTAILDAGGERIFGRSDGVDVSVRDRIARRRRRRPGQRSRWGRRRKPKDPRSFPAASRVQKFAPGSWRHPTEGRPQTGEAAMSSTVKDLVTSSGIKFADAGDYESRKCQISGGFSMFSTRIQYFLTSSRQFVVAEQARRAFDNTGLPDRPTLTYVTQIGRAPNT